MSAAKVEKKPEDKSKKEKSKREKSKRERSKREKSKREKSKKEKSKKAPKDAAKKSKEGKTIDDEGDVKYSVKFMKRLQALPESAFTIETGPVRLQTLRDSKIKLTADNMVTGAAQCAQAGIELGDIILEINGKKVANREESKKMFTEAKKDALKISAGKSTDFDLQITRKRLRRLKLANMPQMLVSEDLPKGFEFYEALIALYPSSTIGFNVKPAINQRCMVSSVDGGWKSMAKKIFQVGDIILYLSGDKEGQEVSSVMTAKQALAKYAKGGIISVWFARAKDPVCVKQVRAALAQGKKPPSRDPRMTADCLDIVKDELKAMDYRKQKNLTFPAVVKDFNADEKRRIDFRKTSKYARIGVEAHVNPHHLCSVPPKEAKKKEKAASPQAAPAPSTNLLTALFRKTMKRKSKEPAAPSPKAEKEQNAKDDGKGGAAPTAASPGPESGSDRPTDSSKKDGH